MPSVTMKEGTFHCSTTKPLTKPHKAPTPMQPRSASGIETKAGRPVRHDQRPDHRAQRQHRADREVDAAGQDDEGHARREHRVDADLDEDFQEIFGRGEIGRGQREEDHDQDERDRDARLAQAEAQKVVPQDGGASPARGLSRFAHLEIPRRPSTRCDAGRTRPARRRRQSGPWRRRECDCRRRATRAGRKR